jgi:hypothetical protein
MQPIMNVLSRMLDNHEPYPAIVLDRMWNVKMQNRAANILFEVTGDPEELWRQIGDSGEKNIALLCVHPQGLRQFISNWDEVGSLFMRRLKREALESGDDEIMATYEHLESVAGSDCPQGNMADPLMPIIPLEFELGTLRLSLFSVISTFGTAQDITTNELRIESFYPTDEQTAKFFRE